MEAGGSHAQMAGAGPGQAWVAVLQAGGYRSAGAPGEATRGAVEAGELDVPGDVPGQHVLLHVLHVLLHEEARAQAGRSHAQMDH